MDPSVALIRTVLNTDPTVPLDQAHRRILAEPSVIDNAIGFLSAERTTV